MEALNINRILLERNDRISQIYHVKRYLSVRGGNMRLSDIHNEFAISTERLIC